jgi:hypothetical protein
MSDSRTCAQLEMVATLTPFSRDERSSKIESSVKESRLHAPLESKRAEATRLARCERSRGNVPDGDAGIGVVAECDPVAVDIAAV